MSVEVDISYVENYSIERSIPKGTRTYVDAKNTRASADCGLSLPLGGGGFNAGSVTHNA